MNEQLTLAEHVVEVFEDVKLTPTWPWFFWRCSCGGGRRGSYDGIYSLREVAQARADDHLAEVGGAR